MRLPPRARLRAGRGLPTGSDRSLCRYSRRRVLVRYNGRRGGARPLAGVAAVRREGADMADRQPQIIMEEVTDPEELARGQAWKARADRNAAWLQAHAAEVYPRHRGKFICVAGEELFVADTPTEVRALARSAHPDDDAFLLHFIPLEKVARIYAG